MAILHCLWIGGLAGLLAGSLFRTRAGLATFASSVAVGILGALLGCLVASWVEPKADQSPLLDPIAAALGAVAVLMAWSVAQRTLQAAETRDKSSDRA